MVNIFETNFDYESRLEKIRKLMEEREIDCLLSHKWPNQYYVSGFYQHLPWYPLTTHPGEAPLILFREKDKAAMAAGKRLRHAHGAEFVARPQVAAVNSCTACRARERRLRKLAGDISSTFAASV